MILAKPYARLMDIPSITEGMLLLKKIEWCGRISHRSEEAQTADTCQRFIQAVVLQHGDWSIVEHASASVDFYVDRGVTHELVRHRLFAFTQESTRFVNYAKKMQPAFVYPQEIKSGHVSDESTDFKVWQRAIEACEAAYIRLLELGYTPQIARSVFPNALASRVIVTGNLRNWRHFFLMRTTKETHPQMREVTIPLLEEFQSKIPILYDDIEPMARQVDNLKRGR